MSKRLLCNDHNKEEERGRGESKKEKKRKRRGRGWKKKKEKKRGGGGSLEEDGDGGNVKFRGAIAMSSHFTQASSLNLPGLVGREVCKV